MEKKGGNSSVRWVELGQLNFQPVWLAPICNSNLVHVDRFWGLEYVLCLYHDGYKPKHPRITVELKFCFYMELPKLNSGIGASPSTAMMIMIWKQTKGSTTRFRMKQIDIEICKRTDVISSNGYIKASEFQYAISQNHLNEVASILMMFHGIVHYEAPFRRLQNFTVSIDMRIPGYQFDSEDECWEETKNSWRSRSSALVARRTRNPWQVGNVIVTHAFRSQDIYTACTCIRQYLGLRVLC